jgi:CheY-like chemotaxis protein
MNPSRNLQVILIAEDNEDHYLLIRDALREAGFTHELPWVENGQDLLEYLQHKEPRPDLILLDLNMPKKDGREALQEIQSHPRLREIPVVVLTTSKSEEDRLRSHELGAQSFVTKPLTFDQWVDCMKKILNSYKNPF